MKILKFEGASMRETLAKVKAELGDQAVVVSTRQIRRGLLGSAYEIAAAIDQDDDGPTVPAPVPARPMARPTLDDGEVERVVAPLRAELRSLRAMMRARADERPAPNPDLREELAALATALGGLAQVEVHLTIAAATAPAVIDELAQRFAPLRPRRLLFTKVDECGRVPELTLTPKRLGLPVTWLATGQAVPEDLELATVARLIELARHGLIDDQAAA